MTSDAIVPSIKLAVLGLAALMTIAFAGAVGAQQALPLSHVLTFEDAEGRVVRTSDFPHKWLLVYFGYTHCADLCPTGLSVLVNALEQIGPAADHIQPLFVTLDPERDTGVVLREFTAAFDRRLIGLTGTMGQIQDAAQALGVSFQKVPQGAANYVVDHSSGYMLIDPSRSTATPLKFAEPHLLAAKLVAVLTTAGFTLQNVNNVGAYR